MSYQLKEVNNMFTYYGTKYTLEEFLIIVALHKLGA